MNLPLWRASESRRKGIVGDRRNGMNLKAHLPIIALCAVTFAVSFALGLWWEMSQWEEWGTSESYGKDVNQSVAKRWTDKEKTKSEKEGQTDAEQEKVAADKKDEPAEVEKSEECSETRPVEVTLEPGVVPNISSTAIPVEVRLSVIKEPGGVKTIDLKNLSPEMRERITRISPNEDGFVMVEISSESDSSITITDEAEMIIVEPEEK